jgi:hypothetical protein
MSDEPTSEQIEWALGLLTKMTPAEVNEVERLIDAGRGLSEAEQEPLRQKLNALFDRKAS